MRRKGDNTLVIIVDQWPAWAFSYRGSFVSTPTLDSLAERGTVFVNAFTTAPLCSPARGSLLTGKWPCEHGVRDNVGVGYSVQQPLAQDEETWIERAARNGFHVGYFGKWHLGRDGPIIRGAHRHSSSFDAHAKVYDPAHSDYSYRRQALRYQEHKKNLKQGRPPFWGINPGTKEQMPPFKLAREAADFLREYRASFADVPFFLTVSFAGPHFPHYLPEEYATRADAVDVHVPENIADDFYGKPWFHPVPWWPSMDTKDINEEEWRKIVAFSSLHISAVDEAIGLLLSALEELGLGRCTRIVFVSDHGDMCGNHNRFDKGPYFYEEVWRIPLIVCVPGARGQERKEFVSLVDVGKMLLQWAGGDGEKTPTPRNLMDLVIGGESGEKIWPQEVFGMYDYYNGMSFAIRAIRTERYKYVWNPQAVDELYDLLRDPAELTNISGRPELAEVESALRRRLAAWMEELGDDLPERAGTLPPAGTIVATNRPGP